LDVVGGARNKVSRGEVKGKGEGVGVGFFGKVECMGGARFQRRVVQGGRGAFLNLTRKVGGDRGCRGGVGNNDRETSGGQRWGVFLCWVY